MQLVLLGKVGHIMDVAALGGGGEIAQLHAFDPALTLTVSCDGSLEKLDRSLGNNRSVDTVGIETEYCVSGLVHRALACVQALTRRRSLLDSPGRQLAQVRPPAAP